MKGFLARKGIEIPRKNEYLVRCLEQELENERAGRAAFEDLWNKQFRFLMRNSVKNSAEFDDTS